VNADLEGLQIMNAVSSIRSIPYSRERLQAEQELEILRTQSIPIVPQKTTDGTILVDWYTSDDPANPQNWSSLKKSFIVFVICMYTWVTYVAGSVFVAAEPGIQKHFEVSPVASELGLALFVLAYGIGPLIFGPITEIPVVGRNHVYYLTFVAFYALSFPTATVDSFGGLLALRFFAGFFGSVGIAIGGASIGDIFSLIYFPYGLCWWILSFWAGPAIGPMIGGFAAMAKGWRWPLWEIVWLSSPMVVLLLCLTPETSTPNILLRRAQRLRELTGDPRLQAQSEINQGNSTASELLSAALIGVAIFTIGMFYIVQGLFVYVPISYPQYAASIFTGNDLIRSIMASACILAARPLFLNLGVHNGVTVLAGLSVLGIPGTLGLYIFGKRLRARSRFAQG